MNVLRAARLDGQRSHRAVDALHQRVGALGLSTGLHLRPFVIENRLDVRTDGRAQLVPSGKDVGVAIGDREHGGLVEGAFLGLLIPLPYADRNEGQQDGVDNADHRQDESGQIVVLDANRARRKTVDEEPNRNRQQHEAADDDDARDHDRQRFEPIHASVRFLYGSGSSDEVPAAGSACVSGAPEVTSWR